MLASCSNYRLTRSSFAVVELGENVGYSLVALKSTFQANISQTYLQKDLEDFYSLAATNVPSGTAPIFDSIDGGVGQSEVQGTSTVIEGDLDLEYAISLVSPQKVCNLSDEYSPIRFIHDLRHCFKRKC